MPHRLPTTDPPVSFWCVNCLLNSLQNFPPPFWQILTSSLSTNPIQKTGFAPASNACLSVCLTDCLSRYGSVTPEGLGCIPTVPGKLFLFVCRDLLANHHHQCHVLIAKRFHTTCCHGDFGVLYRRPPKTVVLQLENYCCQALEATKANFSSAAPLPPPSAEPGPLLDRLTGGLEDTQGGREGGTLSATQDLGHQMKSRCACLFSFKYYRLYLEMCPIKSRWTCQIISNTIPLDPKILPLLLLLTCTYGHIPSNTLLDVQIRIWRFCWAKNQAGHNLDCKKRKRVEKICLALIL